MTRVPILYDPDCGFCRVCIALVLRWDRRGRLRPVSLTSPEADTLLGAMPADARMASWHLVTPDGAVQSAGDAVPELLAHLPRGQWLSRLSARFPGPSGRAYRWVADHRSLLGRALPQVVRRWADGVISGSRPGGR